MNSTHTATISIVGASPEFERRAREAIELVHFNGLPLRFQEWDGTRRSVVLASPESALGEVALRLTRQRGGVALEVSRSNTNDDSRLCEQSSVEKISELLALAGLAGMPRPQQSGEATAANVGAGGALGLICREAPRSGEFLLHRLQHDILVSHSKGRVIARSPHLFGVLKAKLLDDEWTMICDAHLVDGFHDSSGLTATSLETLLVESCNGHRNRLPPQPPGRVSIELIPDIAAISDNGDSLLMAAKLKAGIDDVVHAASSMGVDESKLNAMLWAMQASGLLKRESSAETATERTDSRRPASAPTGLIRRLAMRFGFAGGQHA